MEAAMAQIPNQGLMIWFLFGVLLAWMVTFAVLACRSNPQHDYLTEDLPTSATSVSDLKVPLALHLIATQPVPAQVESGNHDTGEMGTVPVA